MSIINYSLKDSKVSANPLDASNTDLKTALVSAYQPSQAEKDVRTMILRHFSLGYVTMYTPRVEFNDLSVLQRMQIDQMAWNTYQPNNGQPNPADITQAWKSNAVRPVVRNKAISIAAHAGAKVIFPKVFAHDSDSNEQQDAATAMEDLMEYAAEESNYVEYSLRRIIASLTDPISIGYTEYASVYRKVKRPTDKPGIYKEEMMEDKALSGFQDVTVPMDELFIENFFEPDIQKQGWLIWRKIISFDNAQAKYQKYPKFNQYVRPGVQIIYNDANQTFYQVYDWNMRPYDVEEVTYWNKALDLKIILVNGVMLTDADNPNPRTDKQYPFDTFGYELINNRCFYYKSLAFKTQPDATIINTLYPMMIDGTYLNIMPPSAVFGPEVIGSDVFVPGMVTTFKSQDSKFQQLMNNPQGLKAGYDAMNLVETSLNQTTQDPIESGTQPKGDSTAYEISRIEQNASTVLGLFIKMIAKHVRDYGNLRMNDILQYCTIADVEKYEDNPSLVYQTFLLPNKESQGKVKTRKIKFQTMSSEPKTKDKHLEDSYDVLAEQGDDNVEIYKVNPEIFRELSYKVVVSPDILNPRSEDLERAYNLEQYDRLIQNPMADQEEALRLLLSTNPKTRKNPDKYISKQALTPQDPMQQIQLAQAQQSETNQGGQPMPANQGSKASPLKTMANMGGGLPQSFGGGKIS